MYLEFERRNYSSLKSKYEKKKRKKKSLPEEYEFVKENKAMCWEGKKFGKEKMGKRGKKVWILKVQKEKKRGRLRV